MERLSRDVQHGLQKINDVSTAWMDEEIQPSKSMKMKKMSEKD